jgi:hypothetical protein
MCGARCGPLECAQCSSPSSLQRLWRRLLQLFFSLQVSACMLPAIEILHACAAGASCAHPRLCSLGTAEGVQVGAQAAYDTHVSECRCLYIPMEDRSDWPALVARVVPLMQAAVDASPGRAPVRARQGHPHAGGCLACAPGPCRL